MRGIYLIECLANGRVYVGSSLAIRARLTHHRGRLCNRDHSNPHLQAAWNKYGAGKFAFIVAVEMPSATVDELIAMETRIKDGMVDVFNIIEPGAPSMVGRRHTAEARAKMSARALGRPKSPSHRAAIGVAQRGRVLTPEHRAKIAAAGIGRTHSPEARAKQSAAKKGKSFTDEHRAHLREAWKRRRSS